MIYISEILIGCIFKKAVRAKVKFGGIYILGATF